VYSQLEERFLFYFRLLAPDVPLPEREYRFAAHTVGLGQGVRQRLNEAGLQDWRFDFAWPQVKIAVEIEGGIFDRRAHGSIKGILHDIDKYNAATYLGWTIIRLHSKILNDESKLCFELRRLRDFLMEKLTGKNTTMLCTQLNKDGTAQSNSEQKNNSETIARNNATNNARNI